MFKVYLNPPTEELDINQLLTLYEKVGWSPRKEKALLHAIQSSPNICIVKDQNKIIGTGRTIDDNEYYALIVDLMVDPEYQGRGLGKLIIQCLQSRLKNHKFISLTSARGKQSFYEHLGWKKQCTAYFLAKDVDQIREHSLCLSNHHTPPNP
jgi:N-acetylglutamate synthase-like GNAT family acetyltransferase